VRTLGLLGGMSWESSITYEQVINEEVRRRLGGVHSADLLLRSYDFAEIEALQEADDWAGAGRRLGDDARRLEDAGAEAIVLCTNPMHRVADAIESATTIPLLHIAEATSAAIRAAGVGVVALLGTRYTMEQPFLRDRLGVEVVVPDAADRTLVHEVIYEELVRGVVRPESKAAYLGVLERLGADGVVAGCTEIELLLSADDLAVPFFPTARLHALAAVDFALGA
jgi:aspartate racemase